jgi:hypothetical protein
MGVFMLYHGDGRKVLPVFSFEAEAEMFLRLGKTETGWRARETTADELTSLLYGPCSGVSRVALNPLPAVDGVTIFDLAGWSRENFLRNFLGAISAPHHERRGEVLVRPRLLQNPDDNGTPSREPGEGRGRGEQRRAARGQEDAP